MDNLIGWLALYLVKGIGPVRFRKLIDAFGTPDRVFSASSDELKPIVGEKLALRILEKNKVFDEAEKQLSLARKTGCSIVTFKDRDYPAMLRPLDSSPPLIFYRGDIGAIGEETIAMVGTRSPTHYGQRVASELARELASAGFVIVSGGARGIDSYSHRGALEAGGRTVAVLGSGLDRPYPRENKKLFDKIVDSGGVVLSEFPMGTMPSPENFPRRNRIISGLSRGVIVVEAGMTSGALITARWASSQGRDVFAVPGPITSPKSAGCNYLIKMGAKIVLSADDIIEEYGGIEPSKKKEVEIALEGIERGIYNALLQNGPLHVDELSDILDIPSSRLLTHLFVLEMKGVIRELPGKFFSVEK